jgi:hypothetical protein
MCVLLLSLGRRERRTLNPAIALELTKTESSHHYSYHHHQQNKSSYFLLGHPTSTKPTGLYVNIF